MSVIRVIKSTYMTHEIPSARESLTGKYDHASVLEKIQILLSKDLERQSMFDQALNKAGIINVELLYNILGEPENWDEKVGKEISSLIGDIETHSNADIATQKATFAALAQYLNSL
jgi:hypothetical protein